MCEALKSETRVGQECPIVMYLDPYSNVPTIDTSWAGVFCGIYMGPDIIVAGLPLLGSGLGLGLGVRVTVRVRMCPVSKWRSPLHFTHGSPDFFRISSSAQS